MARPIPPQPFKIPSIPGAPRSVRAPGGLQLRPLKGPAIEIPGEEETDDPRIQRYEAFQARGNKASLIEFICMEWLVTRKKQVYGLDFYFQYPFLGGRTQFGGFVLDFYFPARRLAWFVQGLYFHHTKLTDRARDIAAVAVVAARGITVVQVFEDDILNRENYTLSHAWQGEQVSRRAG